MHVRKQTGSHSDMLQGLCAWFASASVLCSVFVCLCPPEVCLWLPFRGSSPAAPGGGVSVAAHLDFMQPKQPRRLLQEGSPFGVGPIKSCCPSAPDGSSSTRGCLPLNTSLHCVSVAPLCSLLVCLVTLANVSLGATTGQLAVAYVLLGAYPSAFL